jgi:hypothetical protein
MMDSQTFSLRSTMTTTWPTDEYQEPPADATAQPQPAVTVPGEVIASTLQTLNLLAEFFRLHASGGTRAELHQFARLQGWDPIQGANHLVDSIGLDAARLTQARDGNGPDQH